MKGNIRNNKNAFGEVHHNLIREILEYHHIPDLVKNLINSFYTGFQTSVINENFNTRFITVGRGVLQGDWSLSKCRGSRVEGKRSRVRVKSRRGG